MRSGFFNSLSRNKREPAHRDLLAEESGANRKMNREVVRSGVNCRDRLVRMEAT
jgi:hypothetical protein